ncbi:uncharacterized protein LOC132746574 [Ruditapes philippinarum]|uniref:uncharacterized protein LOC132746574 n=1 Tax=Ruditapes philippinarum TaxID=129788 RepID=UPI00295BE4A4|nr:uncharacterized protein LOC132746574 [Ruditapes philippinarum]
MCSAPSSSDESDIFDPASINIFCEKHDSKYATAFCLTHKKPICMSCIVQKVHCVDDCKLQEIQYVDRNVLQCLKMKKVINEHDSKLDVNVIEDQMKTEIEAAYSETLAKLEEYKATSYEVTKKEIANVIESDKVSRTQTVLKINEAIDYCISGNMIQCKNITSNIEDTCFVTGIHFQEVIPSFDAQKRALVSVKDISTPEQLQWMDCCIYDLTDSENDMD